MCYEAERMSSESVRLAAEEHYGLDEHGLEDLIDTWNRKSPALVNGNVKVALDSVVKFSPEELQEAVDVHCRDFGD